MHLMTFYKGRIINDKYTYKMEPIKQPARTYLFYHIGNEQKREKNNKKWQKKHFDDLIKLILKIWTRNLQDELKSLVKHF